MLKIITLQKKTLIVIFAGFAIIAAFFTLRNPVGKVFSSIYETVETKLIKENSRLEGVLNSIVPKENNRLYDPPARYLEEIPAVSEIPLSEALDKGKSIGFQILQDDSGYRRKIYTPDWKDAFYRGWLYLPDKNTEARHRLFVYPLGGSATYDFLGSLGFDKGVSFNRHRNIVFLVFDFAVSDIERYQNQLILAGNPRRAGYQIISVVQDEILNPDEKTNDFLIQLSTPGCYEVDYNYDTVIRYDYLLEQIREHSVARSADVQDKTLDELIDNNLSLQKELSYYIPMPEANYRPPDEMDESLCKPIPPSFPLEEKNLRDMYMEGNELPFQVLHDDTSYRRPIYDPSWKTNYKERWAYVPDQICLNSCRLHVFPKDTEELRKMLGMLSFSDSFVPYAEDKTGLITYGFHVDEAVLFNRQILLIGTPQRDGVQQISISNQYLNACSYYLIRLITPDGEEIDYAEMYMNSGTMP